MAIRLGFYGAAQNVTGSCYLVEGPSSRILIDCGFYQERDYKHRNFDPFPFDAESIDAVLLTHAHLDHCGLLPKLVRAGFRGPIWSTPASRDIARIVMLDSAKIQKEDANFKKRRHEKEGRTGPYPPEALYTAEDVETTAGLFREAQNDNVVEVANGIRASFHIAGHILGSSMIRLEVSDGPESRVILF
ncbi:MAG: MBL fold metallo-hydrolase, partial [Nitrospinaceae bacterium]|nr:MBL fold metallo-hydrolase [Nitrospinaceae bacterium]